ncbi:MAG TPA: ammonium transporter [Phycisphaerae bacterium]|nr:ammonium transporter [Phycisphaerae bacterium]
MAMLLVGFGFLMVFVKKYGRSALTATYLLVATAVPLYFLLSSSGVFGHAEGSDIKRLVLAEFAAASLLICAGALLGRIRMWQYIVLGVLFVPCFKFNEWIVLDGGLGLVDPGSVMDTGGSVVIHAFGALFGLGAMLMLTTKKQYETEIVADATSDRYSLLGSMVLWVFWPSFCGALVAAGDVPHTAINVILALCGSTLATYIATVVLRRKISPADIANAALAGGVAIGSTCDVEGFFVQAFFIGIGAGVLSTFGFAVIQDKLQKLLKKTDTCGVLYLHGIPGLFGGLVALGCTKSPASQLMAIAISAGIALVGGVVIGKVLALLGRHADSYNDEAEFELD